MKKNFTKRVLASVVSAATLLSCSAVGVVPTVTAADGQDYGQALETSLYFFDANECGNGVDDNPLTWRGNCHTYDSKAKLSDAKGLSSASKQAIIDQTGDSTYVDVSGGYHDAGDHVKFSMTMGFAATSLAWSYYSYPEAYKETGSEAHLMDILKEMCDYFMKVTYLDSNNEVICFCYQVADGNTDHNVTWESPEKQTYDRVTFWADSSNPSADASGQMASALAACSLAFADKDSDYAQECLKYANALEKFTDKYPKATYEGVGSFYSSGSQNDDVAWSDLWCALANNGGTLPSSYSPKYKLSSQGQYNGEYDCWIYSWDKVWGGYATLLAEVGYDKNTYLNEVKYELNNSGGVNVGTYNAKGWGSSRYNCALQRYAIALAEGDPNSSYAQGAKWQMDYILGNNQKNASFLLGYGDNNPVQLHHRAANPNKTGCTYTCYGSLVGGPTDSNCTYTDYWDQYQSTEPALDYNGCFALACAGLYDLYGGNADTADAVIANASEIDSDHVFGAWYTSTESPTEPPTEPVTDAPTEPPTEPLTEVPTTEPTTDAPTEPVTVVPPTAGEIPDGSDYGNINLDSEVNVADVVAVNTYLLNTSANMLSPEAIANADVVRDNVINTADSSLLMNYVAMMIDKDKLGVK